MTAEEFFQLSERVQSARSLREEIKKAEAVRNLFKCTGMTIVIGLGIDDCGPLESIRLHPNAERYKSIMEIVDGELADLKEQLAKT